MKTRIAAIALLLAASAAPAALAQDHHDQDHPHAEGGGHPQGEPHGGGPRGDFHGGGFHGGDRGGGFRGGDVRGGGHPPMAALQPQQRQAGPPAGAVMRAPAGGGEGWRGGDRRDGGDRNGGHWNGGGDRRGPGAPNPGFQAPQAPPNAGNFQRPGGDQRGRFRDGGGRPDFQPGQGSRGFRDQGRFGGGAPGFERARPSGAGEWRHRPSGDHPRPPPGVHRHWDPGRYPHVYRSHHRFHFRPYIVPPGFYDYAWNYGDYLPSAWFGPQYLVSDWWDFDLPEPPYGYDWVRVGDDAVMVNDYTGEVVQVVRDLFW